MSACTGLDQARSLAAETQWGLAALAGAGGETEDLKRIADYIYSREQ